MQVAFAAELPVRTAAELTGWSAGWVSSRYQELRDAPRPVNGAALAGRP